MISEICVQELGFPSLLLYWFVADFTADNVYNSIGLGIYILQVTRQHIATLCTSLFVQNIVKEHATKIERREGYTEDRPVYVLPYRT
jgi:hypothetical protein